MITAGQLRHTAHWLAQFKTIYNEDVPMRLHSRSLDADGNPDWSDQMRHHMTDTDRRETGPEEGKTRLRRAMKRIRGRSLREYEVLYRVMVMGDSIDNVTDWLNARAVAGGHPERYTPASTSVIVYAAVDKLYSWY